MYEWVIVECDISFGITSVVKVYKITIDKTILCTVKIAEKQPAFIIEQYLENIDGLIKKFPSNISLFNIFTSSMMNTLIKKFKESASFT